ncbi:MAG TPA: hypothetical protein VEA40_07440 [Ramlibacter sp.]|nr:hypothetical protein [Ramlibacter sp.]
MPLPVGSRFLWDAFCDLRRAPGDFTGGGISQQDIAAWMSNYGVRLNPWELDTLLWLDTVYHPVHHRAE